MSGVVLTLNDEDEEERFLSMGPEEENVDLLPGDSLKRRRKNSLHHLSHNRSFTDSRIAGGSLFNLLNTLTLCFVFFGMGLTKSLLQPGNPDFDTKAGFSEEQMPSSVGYVIGFLLGGFLYNKFSKYFILLIISVLLGVVLITVPWTTNLWALDTVYSLIGICNAILMIGGNVICLDFWGYKSGPYVQSIHFCLSLGLLAGPLMIDPLAQTKVPVIVQKALPKGNIILNQSSHSPHPTTRMKREIDPLLLQIFKGTTTKGLAKLKPVFTDGRKLDNSRDWDKVKIQSPPKEEVVPTTVTTPLTTTTTTTSKTTLIDDNLKEIFSSLDKEKISVQNEIARVNDAIRKSDKLLDWVEKSGKLPRREKRSNLILSRKKDKPSVLSNSGPFNRPYGRSRIQPPRYPIVPQGGLWDDSNYEDYDIFNEDYLQPPPKLKKPPEKVEEAIETIAEYLNNPKERNSTTNGTNQSSGTSSTTTLSQTTTTTTTAQTTTTTLSTSTTPQVVTKSRTQTTPTAAPEESTSGSLGRSIRFKPTSSYDNDTENPDLTILNVLNGYGVSHRNVGFILDAVYTLIIAVILMLCICYNPREPRARLLTGESNVIKEENRIFKSTVTVLLFFFSLLHWGIFVSYRQILPRFNLLASSAGYLEQIFMGIFTTTRFFSIFTANLIPPAAMIFTCLSIALLGSIILVFMQQISTSAVWAGVILQAVGLSTLLPTSLVWGEKYISMSAYVISIIGCGLALGEICIPRLFTLLTLEAQTWLGFATMGATTLSGSLFLCVFLMAKRHGIRSLRPRSSGYELAAQEDISGEPLEDLEDDFEMSEPNLNEEEEDEIDTSRPIIS